MTVEFTRRATIDLEEIAEHYRAVAGPRVAERFVGRIEGVIARIERSPQTARGVLARPGMKAASLILFPYVIFFRVLGEGHIRIVHIRHTARRPWEGT